MGASKAQLQQLAQERLDDAASLLAQSRWASAYYLSGYAIELALKACIAGKFKADEIPDKKLVDATYTHRLDDLLKTAGLTLPFKHDCRTDPQLDLYWSVVSDWRETSRYEIKSEPEARTLVGAISDPVHGVFSWVKQHW